MATQVIADGAFGQYQGVRFPAVDLTTSNKASFANKFGGFVRRKGIEFGFFSPYQLSIQDCEALSSIEKTRLNGDLMGL